MVNEAWREPTMLNFVPNSPLSWGEFLELVLQFLHEVIIWRQCRTFTEKRSCMSVSIANTACLLQVRVKRGISYRQSDLQKNTAIT